MRPRRLRALLDDIRPRLADGRRGEHRGQPGDGQPPRARRPAARWASTGSRWACSRSSRTCWPPSTGRRRPTRPARPADCARAAGLRGPQHRPDLRRPRPDAGRPGGRPRRGPRARARITSPGTSSRSSRARRWPARGTPMFDEDEGADAYRRIVGGARGRRLPLVRDGQLRPPRPRVPPQPRLLGRGRLPGRRRRRGEHGGRAALAQHTRGWRATSPRWRRGEAPPRTHEPLDADDMRRERWMLGLRLDRGHAPGVGRAARTARTPSSASAPPACCATTARRSSLTREGRFVQNAILHELMEYA